jgi:hypothetical protein
LKKYNNGNCFKRENRVKNKKTGEERAAPYE